MYTMGYEISIGNYRLGMLDSVEIHKSVELLADVADIDQLVRTIVTAASDRDAKQAIKQVAEYIGEDKIKETIK